MSFHSMNKIFTASVLLLFVAIGGSRTAHGHHIQNRSWHCHYIPVYKDGRKVGRRKTCHGQKVWKPRLPSGSERKDLLERPIVKPGR